MKDNLKFSIPIWLYRITYCVKTFKSLFLHSNTRAYHPRWCINTRVFEGSEFDRLGQSRIRGLPWVARCSRAWQRRYRSCTWCRGPGSSHPTVGCRNGSVRADRRCPPNNSCTRLTKIACDLRPSPGIKHRKTGRAIGILRNHADTYCDEIAGEKCDEKNKSRL